MRMFVTYLGLHFSVNKLPLFLSRNCFAAPRYLLQKNNTLVDGNVLLAYYSLRDGTQLSLIAMLVSWYKFRIEVLFLHLD